MIENISGNLFVTQNNFGDHNLSIRPNPVIGFARFGGFVSLFRVLVHALKKEYAISLQLKQVKHSFPLSSFLHSLDTTSQF